MHDPCTPVMAKYLRWLPVRMQGLVFMVRFYLFFVSKFRAVGIFFFFCLLPLVGLDKYAD